MAVSEAPYVLAFGGNALLPDPFHPEGQEARARELAQAVLLLLDRSPGLVLVPGNGPQVGMILLRVEATRERLPAETLDVLVAETQGSIGVLLARVLQNALRAHGSDVPVLAVLTQTVVDPADPAFGAPSKPVGPTYAADEAEHLRSRLGWAMVETGAGTLRRVVPSPRPLDVVELPSIAAAARAGHVVIAGGGGGVPVQRSADGTLSGLEAVIDKDRTAELIATHVGAPELVVLTGVPRVSVGFGTPEQRELDTISVARARELLAAGEFPRGSMGPKVEAVCRFVTNTGRPGLVTDAEHLGQALEGRAGTRFVPL
jgi:carbamate kinase